MTFWTPQETPPLHWASHKGHEDIVNYPWQDANTKLRDHSGRTALHLAAMAGMAEVVKRLVKAGDDKEAKDRGGRMPLHHAGHLDIARLRGSLSRLARPTMRQGTLDERPHSDVAGPLTEAGAVSGNVCIHIDGILIRSLVRNGVNVGSVHVEALGGSPSYWSLTCIEPLHGLFSSIILTQRGAVY